MKISESYENINKLQNKLINHYTAIFDIVKNNSLGIKVIGSMNMIGNPAKLVSNL